MVGFNDSFPFGPKNPIFKCELLVPGSVYISGQIITTSADLTPNGGLIRELPKNPLNSGLGIILICPDIYNIHIYQQVKITIRSVEKKRGSIFLV